jgi:hypothetical protein
MENASVQPEDRTSRDLLLARATRVTYLPVLVEHEPPTTAEALTRAARPPPFTLRRRSPSAVAAAYPRSPDRTALALPSRSSLYHARTGYHWLPSLRRPGIPTRPSSSLPRARCKDGRGRCQMCGMQGNRG